MQFKKYQHIERLGNENAEGILKGMCYIFPKIDGTNAQLWWDGALKAGSRKRELSAENDNAGFCGWALKQEIFYRFFNKYPQLRLYGEWLVPHTLKTYKKSAWNNFYVFDVMDGEVYLPYENYKPLLDEFGIEYIPPICKIENPTMDRISSLLNKNTFLIEDGVGEGIVIKNYNYKNPYGKIVWAKVVRNEFKDIHLKNNLTEIKEKKLIEEKIVENYITESLIEKEIAKIKNDCGWSSKQIPQLLSTIYHCLITEEMWDILKKMKNPTIDFKKLLFYCNNMVKEYLKENDLL